MPLSSVEGRRWFPGEWLTRLSHISHYPYSVHVHPSTPHVSALLIPPSYCINSRLLNFHPPSALFFPPHLSPADRLFLTTSPPVFSLFLSSHRASLLMSTSIICPPISPNICLLYCHCSPSPYIFLRSSHSLSPISMACSLSYPLIKEVLTLLVCREQNHLKLFSNSSTAGAQAEAWTRFLKWSSDLCEWTEKCLISKAWEVR